MKHAREDYNRIQDPANLIPDDEPVFLVRAQDLCSVATVQRWIDMAELSGVSPEMIAKVVKLRNDMEAWQLQRKVKIPDL